MRFIVPDVFTVGIICPDILITTYGASVPSDQSSTGCEQVGHTTGYRLHCGANLYFSTDY